MKPVINAPKNQRVERGKRKFKTFATVAVAATVLLSACSTPANNPTANPTSDKSATPNVEVTKQAESEPVAGGELVWAIETKLQTINPALNGQDKATPILKNIFNTYLYLDGEGNYQPWLAESFEASADGKEITLKLKEGVTFSDGSAFNAAAVVKNFEKLKDENYVTLAEIRYLTDVVAVDEFTVKFVLEKADNLFWLFLSIPASSPVSEASLALPQDKLEVGGPELSGIGPFTVESFSQNTELVLKKRADYDWAPEAVAGDQEAAYLDKVIYRTLPEGSTRTGALQQGQVQISSDIQPLDVSLFEADEKFQYLRGSNGGLPYKLYFNISKAPFDDARVREAFVKGVDLAPVIQSIYQGAFEQAHYPVQNVGPFPNKEIDGWNKTDIARANQLLDEAGWSEKNADGVRVKDGKTLTVRTASAAPYVRESRDQLNQAIAASLKQNTGIEYIFQIEDAGTASERSDANDYEVFDVSNGAPDPVANWDALYYASDPSRGFIARGKYNDTELEALIDEGRFNSDQQARVTAYNKLQQLIADKFYSLPIYQAQDNLAATDSVKGILLDEATGQPFGAYTVWLED